MNRYLTYYLAGFRPYLIYYSPKDRLNGVVMVPPVPVSRLNPRRTIFV